MKAGDEFSRLKGQSERNRIDFLRTELETCSTLAGIAQTEHETGHRETAERSLADAEEGYATAARFLSDPKHADQILQEIKAELNAGLQRLRQALDDLRHSSGCSVERFRSGGAWHIEGGRP